MCSKLLCSLASDYERHAQLSLSILSSKSLMAWWQLPVWHYYGSRLSAKTAQGQVRMCRGLLPLWNAIYAKKENSMGVMTQTRVEGNVAGPHVLEMAASSRGPSNPEDPSLRERIRKHRHLPERSRKKLQRQLPLPWLLFMRLVSFIDNTNQG